ncbi:MAG: peptidoglycan recognition protein family protein [Planctomycetota bacterium]|jgi:hypothetical protein
MFSKVSIFCGLLLVLGGCASNNEPMPQIVHNPQPEPRILRSSVVRPSTPRPARLVGNVPRDWLPPSQVEKKWTAIVIHHSATENGNAAIFDKLHREENHWDGIGYDFVIGNGTDSGDGQVEVTFRWREQRTGAHCKTPGNWANEDAAIRNLGSPNLRSQQDPWSDCNRLSRYKLAIAQAQRDARLLNFAS